MAHDLVVMAETIPAREVANGRRAGFSRDSVEHQTGKIEMDGMERLVDDEARIVPEIVQIGRTGSDIRLRKALAVLPELAVRIILQLQADEIGVVGKRAGKTLYRLTVQGFGDRNVDASPRPRDQRRRCIRQAQLPLDPLSEGASQCHSIDPSVEF
ncbi:hypothetical protein [Bradyrhizobium barranii]|uniref:hypothetical protein n=1 Tax=Bradyrhizobium barranii TaxID=2992140 RepID=UPI003CCB679D